MNAPGIFYYDGPRKRLNVFITHPRWEQWLILDWKTQAVLFESETQQQALDIIRAEGWQLKYTQL